MTQRELDVRHVLAAVTSLSTLVSFLGWELGYHSLISSGRFWAFSGIVTLTAFALVRRFFEWDGLADSLVRLSVLACAVIVLCGLVLGGLGRLTLGAYVVAQTGLLGASWRLRWRRSSSAVTERPDVSTFVVAAIGALLAISIAFGMTHAPMTLYDSLSYHLFFPARWLQDHALSIVPTPFSDPAQAYAPGNGELVFLWLMLPFHGDLVARLGQFPFACLAALTLYALARRLGAAPQHAVYPAAFFLLSRPILEQALGANVDLICAALFLTALYLGLIALDRNTVADWALWGIALGLFLGSKYVALAYAPVFALLVFIRGPRRRALWALPGVLMFAVPWYLRNWLVAGSPIYPASLAIGGMTLAQGAFDRGAMLNTVFHTSDVRLLPAILAHAFGPTLFLLWIPVAILGGPGMLAAVGWWPGGFLLLVPALMVPLFWFGFPVNVDSRFLMPAVGPALLPFACVFRRNASWNRLVRTLYAAGMLWIVVGAHAQLPATVPWFMDGWLVLNGLVARRFLIWFGSVATVLALVWWMSSVRPRWTMPMMAGVVGALVVVLVGVGERWCVPSRCDYLDMTSPYLRTDLIFGWRWIAANTRESTVAYSGINLPYPLTGDRLTNRVVYVNIDGHVRWRFHDYDRAYRTGRLTLVGPVLASGSGELIPVTDRPGLQAGALRPRYERLQGYRDAWIHNLRALGVTHLFVSSLTAYEVDYVWHNGRGFPVEDDWASDDPQVFRVEYENPQVRIYAVSLS